MNAPDLKADLRGYLQDCRDAVMWKLGRLSEYDVRRPLTPTGTNLLGLVLDLDAVGRVASWPGRTVTLHRSLVHMLAETSRHAGHADIVRELIDGAAGLRTDEHDMPSEDRAWWAAHRDRVECAAREAGRASD